MDILLLPLSLAWPLLLAMALVVGRLRPFALILMPAAALPALLLAPFSGLSVELSWLLLGMRLGVDEIGALFVLLAGLLWSASGIYARGYLAKDPERIRFHVFYLLTLTGNLGTILALDMVSFYLFFALMTFASYGLIIHDTTQEARRAGRVYLILGVFGEALLVVAFMLIASHLGNADLLKLKPLLAELPQRDLIIGLILVGYGIKMGVVPLHVWLALAHPCAPTPASAVLSGIIIKAGLIGWLRFLPLGELALTEWAVLCLSAGLVSAFYGVLAGLPQARPKTVLAYSSFSQMGLITALLGIGFASPEHWPLLLSTVLLFALHHGLAKAALFLGVGITAKAGIWSGFVLAVPALALSGAPLTSGALAKLLFKDTTYWAPAGWTDWLPALLTASSLATSLLMARFLCLAWPRQRNAVSIWLWLPWLLLFMAVVLLPWWWAGQHFPDAPARALTGKALLEGLWPVASAAILAVMAWALWRRKGYPPIPYLPEGDIVQPLIQLIAGLPRPIIKAWTVDSFKRRLGARRLRSEGRLLQEGERRLRNGGTVGMLFLLLAGGLIALLLISS